MAGGSRAFLTAGDDRPLRLIGRIADVVHAVRLGQGAAVPEEVLVLPDEAASLAAAVDRLGLHLGGLVEARAVADPDGAGLQPRQQSPALGLGRRDRSLRA